MLKRKQYKSGSSGALSFSTSQAASFFLLVHGEKAVFKLHNGKYQHPILKDPLALCSCSEQGSKACNSAGVCPACAGFCVYQLRLLPLTLLPPLEICFLAHQASTVYSKKVLVTCCHLGIWLL